jgi:hypothetical protein
MQINSIAALNRCHVEFYRPACEAARAGEPYVAPHPARTTDDAAAVQTDPQPTFVGSFRHHGPVVFRIPESEAHVG